MPIKSKGLSVLLSVFIIPLITSDQPINVNNLKVVKLKTYLVGGLVWKGESVLNSNWNKITETPDGKVWYCGGDHWGMYVTVDLVTRLSVEKVTT